MLKSSIFPDRTAPLYEVTSLGGTSLTLVKLLVAPAVPPMATVKVLLSPVAFGFKWIICPAPGYVFWKEPVPSFRATSSKLTLTVVAPSPSRFTPTFIASMPPVILVVVNVLLVATVVPSSFNSPTFAPVAGLASIFSSIRYQVPVLRTDEAEPICVAPSWVNSFRVLVVVSTTVRFSNPALRWRPIIVVSALGAVVMFRYVLK